MQFTEEYEILVEALTECKIKIQSVQNKELTGLINRLLMPINQNISALSVQLGNKVQGDIERAKAKPGEPLLRMFGKSIATTGKKNEDQAAIVDRRFEREKDIRERQKTEASESELNVIRKRIADLLAIISTESVDVILDKFNDIEIRGAAVKIGLPFTETTPERIDTAVIQMMKDSYAKKLAQDAGKLPEVDINKVNPNGDINK